VIDDSIVFLRHDGILTQKDILKMTEILESDTIKNNVNISIVTNIITVFIEMSQNVLKYSKTILENNDEIKSAGVLLVSKDIQNNYYIQSQNIISTKDKEKIKTKLNSIKSLDKSEIKTIYKELRRSGENTHTKGGGIGFYEIAKRCDDINFSFLKLNSAKSIFHLKIKINSKQ
jgi:hypothetical protein